MQREDREPLKEAGSKGIAATKGFSWLRLGYDSGFGAGSVPPLWCTRQKDESGLMEVDDVDPNGSHL